MYTLLEISNEEIMNRSEEKVNDKDYQKTESLLWDLFKKFPENKEPYQIAVKVLLLDKLYSTQIFRYQSLEFLNKIVENIRTITDFDERVKNGDTEIVGEIYRGFNKSLFSFATKYCCLHNTVIYDRDDYSIYDSSVHRLLPKYSKSVGIKLTGAKIDEWRKSGDYKSLNEAVDTVLDKAEITVSGRKRKFDLFLWSQRNKI